MTEEKLIKSDERVKNLGEVFTPKRIVDFMLDQPEITAKINELSATFLEPSAGEGAFLVELLHRKIAVALEVSQNADEFGDNCLVGLSSLYGIELMEDNIEMLVMKMSAAFNMDYQEGLKKFSGQVDDKVIRSAMVIIQANMVNGNALTKLDGDGNPIIFSEWKLLKKKGKRQKVQRLEYTFQEIIDGVDESSGKITPEVQEEQLDLFNFLDETYQPEKEVKPVPKVQYVPCKLTDIYKKETKEV